jgi:hypothetical protein
MLYMPHQCTFNTNYYKTIKAISDELLKKLKVFCYK